MTEEIYVDYEGWRIKPPFICMCCGVEVSVEQWCFGRTCGICDMGACSSMNSAFNPAYAHLHPAWWRPLGTSRADGMRAYAEAVGAESLVTQKENAEEAR